MSDNNQQPKKRKQVQIHVRCDEDLATAFKLCAEQNGYSQSLVLREMMKEYLKRNGQMDLFR